MHANPSHPGLNYESLTLAPDKALPPMDPRPFLTFLEYVVDFLKRYENSAVGHC